MAKAKKTRTWEYILRDDQELPEDDQTVWTLQPLSHRAMAEMADAQTQEVGDAGKIHVYMMLGTRRRIALRYGLKSVANFTDESGQEVSFEAGAPVPDSFLDRLEDSWLDELAAQILRSGGPMTVDEVEK
jgi:hypothetical protein